MELGLLSQAMVNGLTLAMIYSLAAVGLTLIYGIMRIIQFAHGHIYMLGAFAVFFLFQQAGLNYGLALIISVLLLAALGLLIERVFFRPLRGQDLPSMACAVGLLLLLEGSAAAAFGTSDRYVGAIFPGVSGVAGVIVPNQRLLIIGVSLLMILLLYFFLHRTRIGRAMRATALDAVGSVLQGVNTNRINSMGFAIGSGLAALAGGLIIPIAVLNPAIGVEVTIKAFIVIILGGLGSITGALVGALIIGLVESFGYTFLGTGTALISYIIVILVLIFRPTGLFGHV